MAKKQSKPVKKGAGAKRPAASKQVKKLQSKKVPVKRPAAKLTPKKVALKKAAAVKKTPVSKKAPVAKVPHERKISAKAKTVEKTAVPVPDVAAEPVPVVPTRAPIRKIFGANNKVISVAEKGTPLSSAPASSAQASSVPDPEPEPKSSGPELPIFIPAIPAVSAAAPLAKVPWNSLPDAVPANVRFLLNSAIKESENASSSPFPFAKFISALPQELCGLEFAMLILNLEHAPEEIGRLCGFTTERVLGLISTGETAITDKFAALCPDMYRKWRAQFAGRTVSVEALIEHHVVSKVDRNFQAVLAGVVLSAMGMKSPAFAVPLHAVNLGRVH